MKILQHDRSLQASPRRRSKQLFVKSARRDISRLFVRIRVSIVRLHSNLSSVFWLSCTRILRNSFESSDLVTTDDDRRCLRFGIVFVRIFYLYCHFLIKISDPLLSSDTREIIEDLSDENIACVQSDIETEDFPEDYPALENFCSGSGEEYISDFDDKDPSDQEIENVPGPSNRYRTPHRPRPRQNYVDNWEEKEKFLPAAHQNIHQF
ncbi:hypothetical protein J6590_093924 [Homalodisca vitripennis]|nr:hypothetical protein J6590_093924 [Homalodisca vitripennis]